MKGGKEMEKKVVGGQNEKPPDDIIRIQLRKDACECTGVHICVCTCACV